MAALSPDPNVPSVLPGIPGYDQQNVQPWTVQVVVSVTILAAVSVALRIWSRHLKGQKLWWDDYMIIFSMVWNLLVVGFIFAMYSQGMGLHADKVGVDRIVMMAKYLVVAEILYAWNLGWSKLSLLLMYYRIFHVPFFKRVAWAVGAFVMAWVVCISFLFIFICVPVEKLWYPDLPGHCIDQVGTWIANAASTLLTDMVILLLPAPQVWRLQLRLAEKIALTFAFGLGFFVVFVSAYRTSVLFTYSNNDPSYTLAPTVGWTAIEISAGIVSACLPTLRPVIQLLARAIGITGSLGGFFRGATRGTHGSGSRDDAYSKGTGTPAPGSRLDHKSHTTSNTLATTSGEDDEDEFSGSNTSAPKARRIPSFKSPFQRLPDEQSEAEVGYGANKASGMGGNQATKPSDAALRPDVTGFAFTVSSQGEAGAKSERSDDSGDEIPLQGIKVQRTYMSSG
ncbi:hypothetical protein GGTG_08009 [Gaeumannomyces tritici R3-111a-1]|uniref:Rhodopsin domain-containing protein n=1 Tax=Gaeumannomyces tritici (strain R3-111a-1) TaxID=644352 RepID=J3P3C1_GAET3|nr:hypothetical protein GGTG_08009 [Gaeumannomyces tritici R3-111a-1]EJT74163.1 hypothetical protein GGTG_08009 [Gaeumannomyces tritici R3-111a-1]